MGNRPPFETFKGATCRGCLALGTACGTCEKCAWERAQMDTAPAVAESWDKRDEELALCIGFLKLGARVASEIRNVHGKVDENSEATQGLKALVTMALTAFPDYQKSSVAIDDLAARCGFRIEERTIQHGAEGLKQ